MAVEQLPVQQPATSQSRSELSFPKYSLADSIEVPKAIYVQGGGACTLEHLATYLGYKGTNNGAFASKVGAARTFGLVQKSGNLFQATPLAHTILSPTYPHEAKNALVEAFFNAELFRRVHDDFKGRELPPEFGMKNAMRNQYGILPSRVDLAYRVLIESAETAGFFATRAGAKTHLIVPMIHVGAGIHATQAPVAADSGPSFGGGGGGGDGPTQPPQAPSSNPGSSAAVGANQSKSLSDVKAQYLSTLIKLFETKSANGELDEKLMERIERLLNGE
ncbi:hypothetical protein [Hydrogenophaga taeniospiralis]|uniref:hypothetical protein n=1 Tax=Hydrogenophaga taeniospiralis TaxID=65656 RepID=UPI000A7E8AE7|nr:hypothetical protein [Hydrogenophaga taeniospiralis]